MFRFLRFIFDLLEKQDPQTVLLLKQAPAFWKELISIRKLSDFSLCFFPYQDESVKRAILEIKSGNNRHLLQALTSVAAEYLLEELSEMIAWGFCPEIAVAIPPSDKHKGFNHSFEIAKELLKDISPEIKLVKNLLIKTKATVIQHSLPRAQRLSNLKNSMKVKNPAVVLGKDVLVIDDITTTGATFEEARRALLEAGARKVFCVALAH